MFEHFETIQSIIQNESPKTMQNELDKFHASDIAEIFPYLTDDDLMHALMVLNHHRLGEIFTHVDNKSIIRKLRRLEKNKVARIISVMAQDDATDLLKAFDKEHREGYLALLDKSEAETLKQLISYKEETAGSIMITNFITLQKNMDVKEAMKALVHGATSKQSIQRLFILDDGNFLEGAINLKHLIQARAPKQIEALMDTEIISVKENTSTEDVARLMQNYGINLMPVVNDTNQLQGVITLDDAADVLDEETDEDYARFAMISKHENIHRNVIKSALHRLPWLMILLVLGLMVSGILSNFEATIEQITVLVFFLPLILDMGGNVGTQSLAVTVRGISKHHYSKGEAARRHILKELRVGFINGLAIAVLSFFTSLIFLNVIHAVGMVSLTHPAALISLSIALSLFVALLLASFFGALIPLTLNQLNIDPAVASGPFITTLNDIFGLIIYFLLAGFLILNVWGA